MLTGDRNADGAHRSHLSVNSFIDWRTFRAQLESLSRIKMVTPDELRFATGWRSPVSQGVSMSRFVVSFMKDVLGENGHQLEVCQKILEVDARDEGEAAELAKEKFCSTERLCEWSLHADRIQVRAEDFSS